MRSAGFLMVVHAGFPAIAFNPSLICNNLDRTQYPLTIHRCFGGSVAHRRQFASKLSVKMEKNDAKPASKWKLPGVVGVPIQHYIDQYGRCAHLFFLAEISQRGQHSASFSLQFSRGCFSHIRPRAAP
jgi:hypothetical protein